MFIRAAACISPQHTFGTIPFLDQVVLYDQPFLKAIEPDYNQFIDPKSARRMSHLIKMGITAAQHCLQGESQPGAIITGTGYGCLEDTVTFLSRMIELEEELLPPTAFIQSTHNSVAAQIALQLRCHSYNNTFVHKGSSFEHALTDARMLLDEKEADTVLVGGLDEVTPTSFKVLSRLGQVKLGKLSSASLFDSVSRGALSGEGAAFFLMSGVPAEANLAELVALEILHHPKTDLRHLAFAFLTENGFHPGQVDLLITGQNGDHAGDQFYKSLSGLAFPEASLVRYKHLCGEYPTASAFALWLAASILENQKVPAELLERKLNRVPETILICNRLPENTVTFMLVRKKP